MIQKIKAEIKQAMIDKNELRKGVLRAVQSAAQLKAKEEKRDVTNDDVMQALIKEQKGYNQALAMCEENNSTDSDFYRTTKESLAVIEEFLPKQMTEDEAKTEIARLLEGVDLSNRGIVMQTVMGELKGKMDGKKLNALVQDYLKSQN